MWKGYWYLTAFVLLFAVLRVTWFVPVAAIALCGLVNFQFFDGRRGVYLVALVICIGFVVADMIYPTEESKPTTTTASEEESKPTTKSVSVNVVYDGKYSEFPCDDYGTRQGYSIIDHRPCKPKPISVYEAPMPDNNIPPPPPDFVADPTIAGAAASQQTQTQAPQALAAGTTEGAALTQDKATVRCGGADADRLMFLDNQAINVEARIPCGEKVEVLPITGAGTVKIRRSNGQSGYVFFDAIGGY